MREIEFRGKRKDNGEWVHGDLVHDIPGNPMINVREGVYDGDDFLVIPETMGQYTGLKDKNDVKIFEGDILKSEFNSHSIIVTWSDRDAEFKFMQGAIPFKPSVSLCASVIGTIHDTTDLLDRNKIEEEAK